MAVYTHQILIDWNNDGNFSHAKSDVSAYLIKSVETIGRTQFIGTNGPINIAQTGTCTLTLRNESKLFTPGNTSSLIYGKMVPDIKIKIIETVNVTDALGTHSGTYTIYYGYIRLYKPMSGSNSVRSIDIECQDIIGLLQRRKLGFPLQYNQRADQIVMGLISTALGAPKNTVTVTLTVGKNPVNGDTFTLNLPNGTFVLTFTTSSPAIVTNTVLIGANDLATRQNLAAAISQLYGLNLTYGPNTITQDVSAVADLPQPTITLTSVVSGNGTCAAFSVSSSSIWFTFSNGGVGTGGVDWPVGLMAYDVARTYPALAAHHWIKDKTPVLTAIQEVTDSEQGQFYQRADGTVTWKNRDYQFNLVAQAYAATIENAAPGTDTSPEYVGTMTVDEVFGIVNVSASPHDTHAIGVIARPTSIISVPGKSTRKLTLKFFDPDTGVPCGAQTIQAITPITDWVANERKDGKGVDYTPGVNPALLNGPYLTISYIITATGIDLTFTNIATGTLYLTKFQVRGVAITSYSPITQTTTNNAAGVAMTINLPLTEDLDYTLSLSQYISNKFGTAVYRYRELNFKAHPTNYSGPGSVQVVLSLALGNLVLVNDGQIAVPERCEVIGMHVELNPQEARTIYYVQPMDDVTYWVLGDATFGVLGTTSRLAV
jgi:hypothetical protein